ncbi:MAG TPA: hypothetical protein VEB21_19925, partial [Terriglobales bacterium]|nr:hypothetical protein [Terriglobales bacterium]
DANIRRVLARLFCLSSPQDVARTAEQLLDRDRPGDWNQALMELGETICTAAAPRCTVCPWRRRCRARCGDRVASYPPAKARRRRERIDVELLLLQDAAGRLLLERGEFPYLRHLWLPLWHRPNLRSDRAAVLGELRHAILHRDLRVTVYGQVVASRRMQALAAEKGELGRRIFAPAELQQIGRSSLLTKSLRLARLV